jgi:hypothetical protein
LFGSLAERCFGWAADGLEQVWRILRDGWSLVRIVRFAILGLAVYAAVLLSAQGVDSLLTLLDQPWWPWLLINYFAFQTWQWARLMVTYRYLPLDRRDIDDAALLEIRERAQQRLAQLELDYAEGRRSTPRDCAELQRLRRSQRHLSSTVERIQKRNRSLQSGVAMARLQRWMVWLPRLLGGLAFLLVSAALCRAARTYGGLSAGDTRLLYAYSALMLLNGVGFVAFTVVRRSLVNQLAQLCSGSHPSPWQRWLARVLTIDSSRELLERWRWRRFWDLPANTRYWLLLWGALGALLFLGTLIDPSAFERVGALGNVALALAFWNVVGSTLVWLCDHRRIPLLTLIGLWGLLMSLCFDNHSLRSLPTPAAARPDVDTFLNGYLAQSPTPTTPVIVATAGGGIRAAYWTALVLAQLDGDAQSHGVFRRSLLALSAVSGGGLGAAAYLAAQRAIPDSDAELMTKKLDAFLAHDFLAPTAATLLGGDLVYSLLPLYPFADRATALENAWERGWNAEFAGDQSFAQGYLALQQGMGTPALLINGALVGNGERIVTSPFEVPPGAFREAHDLFHHIGDRDLPLSTAVLNGARFPYVSPAGTLRDGEGKVHGQIVDGGYFENFGADTARDLLQILCEPTGEEPSETRVSLCGPLGMRPIVVQISSDPELPSDSEPEAPEVERDAQAAAPVLAFWNARNARGESAMRELRTVTTQRYCGTFVHLRLVHSPDQGDPPLGWVLSRAARETIQRSAQSLVNTELFGKVARALRMELPCELE